MPLHRAPMICDGGVGILKQPTRSKVRRSIAIGVDVDFMDFGDQWLIDSGFWGFFHPLFGVVAVDDLLNFDLG